MLYSVTERIKKGLLALAFLVVLLFSLGQNTVLANHVVDAGNNQTFTYGFGTNQRTLTGWVQNISFLSSTHWYECEDAGGNCEPSTNSILCSNTQANIISSSGSSATVDFDSPGEKCFVYAYEGFGTEYDTVCVQALSQNPSITSAAVDCSSGSPQVDISWDSLPGSNGQSLYRSPVGTNCRVWPGDPAPAGCASIGSSTGGNSGSASDAGVQFGQSYTYTLSGGQTSNCQDRLIDTVNVTIPTSCVSTPETPTSLTAAAECPAPGNPRVRLSWTAMAGADNYEISRCSGAGCGPSYFTTANASPYLNTSVTNGTLYRYRVRACNAGGCSANSSIQEATPNCSVSPPPPATPPPSPSCSTATFNTNTSGYFNNAGSKVADMCVNTTFKIRCDYGAAVTGVGNIAAPTGCVWSRWVGSAAEFDCASISNPQTISRDCSISAGADQAGGSIVVCNASTNSLGNLTIDSCGVTPPPVGPPPPVTPPPPVAPPPVAPPPPSGPVCTGVSVSALTVTGPSASYDVTVTGVPLSAYRVMVPHWSNVVVGGNEQNDIGGWPWPSATDLGGGTWRINVQLDHHMPGAPEYGSVINHVYINEAQPQLYCGQATVAWNAPPPPGSNPVGYHDSNDCAVQQGWTCDADNYSQALNVNIYADGPAGTGVLVGSNVPANFSRPDVASSCGGNANHGIEWTIPSSLKTGTDHTLYMYGINVGGGADALLGNAPAMINCAPPPATPTNSAQCIAINAPTSVEAGTPFSTTVIMKNNGTKPWAKTTNHRLGALDSSTAPWTSIWWPMRVDLPSNSVQPDASATFQFNTYAPSSAGTYPNFGWKMLEENIEWFGAACTQSVTITPTPTPPAVTEASCSTSWGPEITLGGNPNVAWNPVMENLPFGDERLVIAMLGADGYVYVAEWENALRKDWYRVNSAETNARPKLVTVGGELWLFIQGLDSAIYKTRYISEGTWEPWIHTSLSSMTGNCTGPCEISTSWGTWRASVVSLAGGYNTLQKCEETLTPPVNPPPPAPQSVLFDLHGHAWSPNIGWIAMNKADARTYPAGANITSVPYKVQVDSNTGYLKGHAWSSSVGWIKFDPQGPYPAGESPAAPARLVNNTLTGWARACSGTYYKDCQSATRTDGWDGWIKLSPAADEPQANYTGYGVSKIAQRLVGFAWGGGSPTASLPADRANSLGWIKFCNPDAPVGDITRCSTNETDPVTIATQPPQISNPLPGGILPEGTTDTTLSLNTNMNAICRFSTTQGTDYDDMTNVFDSLDELLHAIDITGLVDGATYTYYVVCENEFGDESAEVPINFSVDTPPQVQDFTLTHNPYAYDADSDGDHDSHQLSDIQVAEDSGNISSFTTSSVQGLGGFTGNVRLRLAGIAPDEDPIVGTVVGNGVADGPYDSNFNLLIRPSFGSGAGTSEKTVPANSNVEFKLRRLPTLPTGRYMLKIEGTATIDGSPVTHFTELVLVVGEGTSGYRPR
ncbi:MAG: NBR1-Ig-like domain-containing protein [Patescibacteria group bacterium]